MNPLKAPCCRLILTRRELYDLVWSNPTRDLASELGLSDVGLAEVCVTWPFRKLYPRIAMVQSAEERLGHDGAVTLYRPVFG